MGWFSLPPPGDTLLGAKASQRDHGAVSGFQPPDRNERLQCWAARDAYNACLDAHNIMDPLKDADGAQRECPGEEKNFELNCATSWVKYFKQRRLVDIKRELTLRQIEKEGGLVPDTEKRKSGPVA